MVYSDTTESFLKRPLGRTFIVNGFPRPLSLSLRNFRFTTCARTNIRSYDKLRPITKDSYTKRINQPLRIFSTTLNHLSYTSINFYRNKRHSAGFEPATIPFKGIALPLSYECALRCPQRFLRNLVPDYARQTRLDAAGTITLLAARLGSNQRRTGKSGCSTN
jgi:hypothetical protein